MEKEGVEPSGQVLYPLAMARPDAMLCLSLFSMCALRNCTGHPGDRDEPLLTGCGLWKRGEGSL